MEMETGCPDCDLMTDSRINGFCPKHKLEYLEWIYNTAKNEYEAALIEHKAKLETEQKERNQNEKL